jgi:hypothetical protein
VPIPFFFEGLPSYSQKVRPKVGAHPSYVSDFLTTTHGVSLIKSFLKINDLKVRWAIVRLVEELRGPKR